MKYSVAVFVALLGAVVAQQQPRYTSNQPNPNEIVIVRSENENNGDGTFRWLSELSDGSRHEQSGYVKAGPDPENPIQVIQGAYSYISPEGQPIDLQYLADENGFQPSGNHLPTPPPIPEAIRRSIDLINRNIEYQQPRQQPQYQPTAAPQVYQTTLAPQVYQPQQVYRPRPVVQPTRYQPRRP